jgi:tetratricopeptide (TPR) repeat protein
MPRLALLALSLALPPLALAQAPKSDAPRQAPAQETAQPSPAAAERLRGLLAEVDDLYARRDDPGALAAQRARLEEAEKLAPNDYEVLWRLSRLHFWLADDPKLDGKEKSRLGKISWDYGDRATAANPARVEGWHFAASGVGNYALGIGILTALRQGIEGKFKERLSKAEAIDPSFQNGAIQTAWGRFWFELPWPKYSPEKAVKSLEAALKKNPQNVRAHVYLADVHEKEGRPEAAQAELKKALADVPGRYDAPEERRWQEVARHTLTGR